MPHEDYSGVADLDSSWWISTLDGLHSGILPQGLGDVEALSTVSQSHNHDDNPVSVLILGKSELIAL